MLTIQLMLWVANMAFACEANNKVWYMNAFAALFLTVEIALQGL